MDRQIIITADGSDTVFVPGLNVSYHSKHGAIQESMHVFIEAGFWYWSDLNLGRKSKDRPINVFEMGFGTGLNVLLTVMEAEEKGVKVYYETVEKFPLVKDEIDSLNYTSVLKNEELFRQIHECKWNEEARLKDNFVLKKVNQNLKNYSTHQLFNIIYYDAFAPSAQADLWTEEIFKKLFSMLAPGGVLVTYCSKGDVRRAMQSAGFDVKKIPGPRGKREMLRARKVCSL